MLAAGPKTFSMLFGGSAWLICRAWEASK